MTDYEKTTVSMFTATLERREARWPIEGSTSDPDAQKTTRRAMLDWPIEGSTSDPDAQKTTRWAMLEFAVDALNWLRAGIHDGWSAEQVKQYIGAHMDEYRHWQGRV
jgi:hypothetical protein